MHKPLVYSGTLDEFEQNDLTPVIGREFYGLQIRDLLKWDDQHMKDLAATSRRVSLVPQSLKLTQHSFSTRRGLPEEAGCEPSRDERLHCASFDTGRMP